MFKIIAFYNICKLSYTDAEIMQRRFKEAMQENEIKGTILIGENEGINGTVAASVKSIDNFYSLFKEIEIIQNTQFKESFCKINPFDRIKIKIRKEIVTMNCDISFDFNGTRGEYIKPQDWDEFISRDDVIILDTRNDYEYNIGTFDNAINPKIDNFRDLPKWLQENKHLYEGKKLATFCTGGIRCEKLTAYMVQTQYPETYHLETGILGYFETTKNINKKWIGHCFVFDNRIAVNDKLEAI